METRTYVAEDWAAFDDDVVTLIGATNTESCRDYCERGWDTRPRGEVYVIEHVTSSVDVEGWWRVLLFIPLPGTDEILGYYAVGRLKEIREWHLDSGGPDYRRRVELRRALEAMTKMVNRHGMSMEEIGVELVKFRKDMEGSDA